MRPDIWIQTDRPDQQMCEIRIYKGKQISTNKQMQKPPLPLSVQLSMFKGTKSAVTVQSPVSYAVSFCVTEFFRKFTYSYFENYSMVLKARTSRRGN